MAKRLQSSFFVLMFLLIFPGCSLKATGMGPIYDFSSPLAVLERTDAVNSQECGIKAIARIEVNTPEGRYPLKAALALQRPSSLRFETIPVLGPSDFFLTVHRDVLKVFLPQNGKFYTGKATARNLRRFLPVPAAGLEIEDITAILLGAHPLIRGKTITLDASYERNLYRIDVLAERKKLQSLWIDPHEDCLVRVDFFTEDGTRLYSATFGDWEHAEGVTMPRIVKIVYGDNEKPDVIVRYVDIGPSDVMDTALFDLSPPPGVSSISMDR
ncbi:MAG TPA: DUF4292 domain-containing protein [Syntrophales bacterium]|nr:DUF4292 domain-containing protein [Syntrophales bacterium]